MGVVEGDWWYIRLLMNITSEQVQNTLHRHLNMKMLWTWVPGTKYFAPTLEHEKAVDMGAATEQKRDGVTDSKDSL